MMESKQGKASEDGVDMISNLPDPIILSILSRIPTTEEVIRTSILSTRWRYLWTSVPFVDLDCSRGIKPLKNFEKEKFKEFVYWVLVSKSFNLDSFRLCCWNHYSMSTIRRWIYAAVTRNIKSLHLDFRPTEESEIIEFPRCLVTCGSLVVLRLFSFYGWRLILPNYTGFPALRVLELNDVELFNDDLVNNFLKSCPLLEDLTLIDCVIDRLNDFCISCPHLKNLRIDNRHISKTSYNDDEGVCGGVKIVCPKLVFFEFGAVIAKRYSFESLGTLKKAVIHSYNFPLMGDEVRELFVGISHVESLSTSYTILPYAFEFGFQNADVPVYLPNLKLLELTVPANFDDFAELIESLVNLPHLESLHLIIDEDMDFWEPSELEEAETMRIVTCHLKRVEFLSFNCTEPMLDIARSLLEHGKALEEMVFRLGVDKSTFDQRSMETIKEVSKYHKASPTVKLITLLEASC